MTYHSNYPTNLQQHLIIAFPQQIYGRKLT